MKRYVVAITPVIIVLSAFSSYLGVTSYYSREYAIVKTPRGNEVDFLNNGVYKFSSRALAAEGIPWDAVRLLFGIPFLAVSFFFFMRRSLRGTLLYTGLLANFFYQYLLWAYAWAFNHLFLIYVLLYSLSLVCMILVVTSIDPAAVRESIKEKFPSGTISVFMFVVAGFLMFLWLGKMIPASVTDILPEELRGEQTAVTQASDLGLLVPLSLFSGVLLAKRNPFGYILSPAVLVFSVNMCLSILAGSIVGGFETGFMPVAVIVMFVLLMMLSAALLSKALLNIAPTKSFMKIGVWK